MIYTYSIGTYFPEGNLDTRILHDTIGNSSITGVLIGLHTEGDDLKVEFQDALSVPDKDLLDGLIEAAPNSMGLLIKAKEKRYVEIDERTSELIGEGFTYDGKIFSLSRQAQSNMLGVRAAIADYRASGTLSAFEAAFFPLKFNTLDDTDSTGLALVDDFLTFYDTAMGTVRAYLDGGTALKAAIRAAVDIAGVDAVVDER
jgi:hypothetical protein